MKLALLLIALLATPVMAQTKVYRLSEADKQAAIDSAAHGPEQTTRLPVISGRAPGSPDNRAHGEVSMMVGTGGTRAISGSMYLPLGENGSAQMSAGTGRFPVQPLSRYGQAGRAPLLADRFSDPFLDPFGGTGFSGSRCIGLTLPYCR